MKSLTVLILLCLVGSAACIAFGLVRDNLTIWVIVPIIAGGIWVSGLLFAKANRIKPAAHIAFVALIGCAAFLALRKIPAIHSFISALMALMAWDLDGLRTRQLAAGHIDRAPYFTRQHIHRLLGVICIGGFAGGLSLIVNVTIDFWFVLVFAAMIIVGFSYVVRYLLKNSD